MPRNQKPLRKQPTTTAMQVLSAADGRESAIIQNAGTVAVALSSSSDVLFTTGLVLPAGGTLQSDDDGAWYAVAESGTADLRIVRVA